MARRITATLELVETATWEEQQQILKLAAPGAVANLVIKAIARPGICRGTH
ncbi:MAG: hypothetical protein K6T99_00045 [Armatimonadetes bacterium]|nr:hypothetical protein [Armatimonadota bacterium]